MRQLLEYCATCDRQVTTLETCVLPDGTEKRGAEVTFREGAEGGIRRKGCAREGAAAPSLADDLPQIMR